MVNPNKDSVQSDADKTCSNGQNQQVSRRISEPVSPNGDHPSDPLNQNDNFHFIADEDDEDLKNRFTHVRVLHNFRGSNNDELCMKKDDIITLTQTPSGGWWEGTLDGITGWFPSNYVQPIMNPPFDSMVHQQLAGQESGSEMYSTFYPGTSSGPASDPGGGSWSYHRQTQSPQDSLTMMTGDHLAEYRSIVMKVIEDSETQFIQSLQDAIQHYLMPIYQFKILPSETELNAVLRSITEICTVHRRFLTSIEKIKSVPYKENRIGGLFMQYAPQFKHAHFEYCSHHAKFVHMIEKYKKEICQFFSANAHPPPASVAQTLSSPSHAAVMVSSGSSQNLASMPNVQITSLLSVSFRRLDKYPALLQELQRYTEENHADRGDIQRAGFLYREISMSCLELRRRKEMELEVMLGNIKNFDNLNIEIYGQIIKMEPVSILILPNWIEPKKDCYFVLFPKVLMILSVGKEMTSFTFESMMKLEGAKLQPINLPDPHGSSGSGPGSFCQTFPIEILGQNAHPYPDPDQLNYIIGFSTEDVWREYYQVLQKQIRHQTAQQQQSSVEPQSSQSMSLSSTSASLVQQSPAGAGITSTGAGVASSSSSASNSSSAIFSPQSSSISITSPDQPVPTNLPPKPPQYRIQHMMDGPAITPMHHHRPPPPVPPTPPMLFQQATLNLDALCHSLPKRCSYWSDQMLTPHTPYRPMDGIPMTTTVDGVSGGAGSKNNEDQTNDDMQLLNVIDAYHRKFPSGSRGSGVVSGRKHSSDNIGDVNQHSELEPYQYVEIISSARMNSTLHRNPSTRNARKNSLTMLVNKINKLSLSSMDRDVLYEIYDQLRVIRNELSHLSEKVRDERRQRKRLQHSLAKKTGTNIHQQQQQQTSNA